MGGFVIEVEHTDTDNDELWIGREQDIDEEGCLSHSTMLCGTDQNDEEFGSSETVATFNMSDEDLVDFIVDWAPHLISKMAERAIAEREALSALQLKAILDQRIDEVKHNAN